MWMLGSSYIIFNMVYLAFSNMVRHWIYSLDDIPKLCRMIQLIFETFIALTIGLLIMWGIKCILAAAKK